MYWGVKHSFTAALSFKAGRGSHSSETGSWENHLGSLRGGCAFSGTTVPALHWREPENNIKLPALTEPDHKQPLSATHFFRPSFQHLAPAPCRSCKMIFVDAVNPFRGWTLKTGLVQRSTVAKCRQIFHLLSSPVCLINPNCPNPMSLPAPYLLHLLHQPPCPTLSPGPILRYEFTHQYPSLLFFNWFIRGAMQQ